jgi:hypothetical protein
MRAQIAVGAAALLAGAALWLPASATPASGAAAEQGEPVVEQLVVFRDGREVYGERVRARRTTVELGKRTCAVAAATPLAALLRAKRLGKMKLRDYGSCSRKPADSSGLFVRAIRRDRNRGLNGWVYKVGTKLATAGAADPAGPFGDGRLRIRQQVVWFYCVFHEGSCQRSLGVSVTPTAGGATVTVTGYDDAGEGRVVAGATVTARTTGAAPVKQVTDSAGKATIGLAAGRTYTVRAKRKGLIPSFPEEIQIP